MGEKLGIAVASRNLVLDLPSEWDRLPDIGLYMDQVVTYLEREIAFLRKPGEERRVTPSMINNYAKSGIVPRAEGKKYTREHMALLLAVFTLKRVLSVQDMAVLTKGLDGQTDTKAFYELFRACVERGTKDTAAAVARGLGNGDAERKARLELALELAVEASLRSFAAELLLEEKGESEAAEEAPQERKTKSKRTR